MIFKLGYLKPADIKSNLDDVKIDARLGLNEDVDFETQIKNQAAYDKDKKRLQPGDYVYVPAFPPGPLDKSFDSKVGNNKHELNKNTNNLTVFFCTEVSTVHH